MVVQDFVNYARKFTNHPGDFWQLPPGTEHWQSIDCLSYALAHSPITNIYRDPWVNEHLSDYVKDVKLVKFRFLPFMP